YEKSTLRRLIKVSEGIAKDCYLQNDELENVLSSAEHGVFDLIQTRNTRDYKPISEVVMDALRRIEEAAKSEGNLTGLSTGFKDLDDKTTGLQPSDFVLIAARPSMGKTAFALNIAQHVAFKLNQPVAIFSLEMSEDLLVNRLLSMEARVDAQNLRTGNLNENEWGSIMESAETIGKSNLIIDTTSGISISQLRTKARKYKLDKDIQLIIIDYLQLMSGSGKNDNRQSELSEISRGLKSMARELNIPVIALSQLSRKVEDRSDKRPMMSDIRESGAIEQDADIIMFIYREDYYDKETDKINVAEINIAKQRNGPIGPVYLTWQPKYTKFVNSTKEQRN
ncbi:MAG: replicative DNA helicase, partial [Parasporobacterium sp.]|nr:replicative DNA helicase [Parasporobacterium sp.]